MAKRETVKREVIFEMLLIYLNCILHTLLITNYLQTFSVGLRLHRAKQDFCILPHSEWHNLGRKRHLPGKQEKWNIYTNQTQILKEICYSVLYQGDSGGPLYKFNETAHKAVLGSFIDSEHLKKHFWLWVYFLCEELRKWSVTSGCCQQRRGLRSGKRYRYLRSGEGLTPFYDIGLDV